MPGSTDTTANNPASHITLERTPTQDAKEDEVLFSKEETRSIIEHGIAAAVKEFQRRYDEKLSALRARVEASEARNIELSEKVEATQNMNHV
jgi:hypothetical protein